MVTVRSVELRDIETILALAEELHFGRTAQRLVVSTAHVTQTVQAVERGVGGQIFERTSRRVRLTPLGESLVADLAPAFESVRLALATARDRARGVHGVLRIGHLVTSDHIPEVAALACAFERRYPECHVLSLRSDLLNYLEPLERGAVDIWLTWWPGPFPAEEMGDGLRCGAPVAERGRVLLVARGHPLADHTQVRLEDLLEHPVLSPPAGPPKVFREGWNPTTAPNGTPLPTSDHVWHGYLQELPHILGDNRSGWLTHSSIIDSVPALEDLVTVPVTDAPPLTLFPIWRESAETAAVRAFNDLALDGVGGPPAE